MISLNSIAVNDILPPYSRLITPEILALDNGKLLATIKIRGITFETESERVLHNKFLIETRLFNALCRKYTNKLAVWSHIVKTKQQFNQRYQFDNDFIQSFVNKYCDSFNQSDFYTTDYYLTFVYNPSELKEGKEELYNIIKAVSVVFKSFNVTTLSLIETNHGLSCENLKFYSFLFNHYFPDIPFSSDKAIYTVPKSDIHLGYDTMEIRNHETDSSTFAVLYELDVYCQTTYEGMWDFILRIPAEFIICQSLIFMSTAKSIKLIDAKLNEFQSANDSELDIATLQVGKDGLKGGELSFGDYHTSLIVFGDDEDMAIEKGREVSNEFLNCDITWRRSNLDSIFTLKSIFPAATERALSSPRTVANFACGLSFHNQSTGKQLGNPIGDGTALMPLKTRDDGVYWLNCHASDHYKNVTGQKVSGHTLTLGASSTGKTTLIGALVGFTTRFNPLIFCIDYNRSTELFIRAYGGDYYAFQEGHQTGLNPFQLDDDNPELRAFLYRLIARCALEQDGTLNDYDALIIKEAVDSVMSLDFTHRCFSVLLQSIPYGSNLRVRLSKWCRSENGALAWALDSESNAYSGKQYTRLGFDTTFLLEPNGNKIHPACEPILATLFYIKEQMQREGRLLVTIVEEFWMPANFPLTQAVMKRVLKAGRLKSEFMLLNSQSPEDAINCDIFAAIVQQTPTKILLPNPDGDADSYKKLGLSDVEITGILELDKDSRTFLVKQSSDSVFAKFDLYGFDDFLPIISGTTQDIYLCEVIRNEIKSDASEKWIPIFQAVKKSQRVEHSNNEVDIHQLIQHVLQDK
ncbi:conjugal transfer protein TraE [Photobacterium phosphoreum]|uniref:Conjugal transfer protein TraE n=1 Tax=Photobacterium phosphoreum TaxID=659 RepID=A0AAW4ZY97_PHOPO|nr:conjugal transfer protein TraE [Photobacterium phosphoreum]MCD9492626.1 conjugal transfer protein TraE [Photobacterium phosphoreum]MCF2191809.1 conjugal transfer protein TraE [Photobacterium phosphoreum]MCF2303458.1 conjugal transfer protein TraE [Photobacterium phosphoreum]